MDNNDFSKQSQITIDSCPLLRSLSLQSSSLRFFPILKNVPSLGRLNLDNNQISGSIPQIYADLPSLQTLSVARNKGITGVCKYTSLSPLVYLSLANTSITHLDESFSNLAQLASLYLSNTSLISVDSSFWSLPSLETLDVGGSGLERVNSKIGEMSSLRRLSLDRNLLPMLPDTIGNLSLIHLDVSYNYLSTLPNSIGNIKSLLNLFLSHNQLTEAPRFLWDLPILYTLDLSHNLISSLPSSPSLSPLFPTTLAYLSLANNSLSSLPSPICHHDSHQLASLDVRFNQITSLSPTILNCSSLEALHLDGNELTSLPPLPSFLYALTLNNNPLESIPESICDSFIDTLSLSHLNIRTLPDCFDRFRSLLTLSLSDLPNMRQLPTSLYLSPSLELLSVTGGVKLVNLYPFDSTEGRKSNISGLHIYGAEIQIFTENIFCLSNLQELVVVNSGLLSLDAFSTRECGCKTSTVLRVVDLSQNLLHSYTSSACLLSLISLAFLDLSQNMLSGGVLIPKGVWPNLVSLDVSSNPLIAAVSIQSDSIISVRLKNCTNIRALSLTSLDPFFSSPLTIDLHGAGDISRFGVSRGIGQNTPYPKDYHLTCVPLVISPPFKAGEHQLVLAYPEQFQYKHCKCLSDNMYFSLSDRSCFKNERKREIITDYGSSVVDPHFRIKRGIFPLSMNYNVLCAVDMYSKECQFLPCRIPSICNPNEDAIYRCEVGYSRDSFLCSKCEKGYFARNDVCRLCMENTSRTNTITWTVLLVSLFTCKCLLLFSLSFFLSFFTFFLLSRSLPFLSLFFPASSLARSFPSPFLTHILSPSQ